MSAISPSQRRALVWLLRIAVLVAVAWGVRGTFQRALDQLAQHEWRLYYPWLVPAGAFYILGLVPMARFWHRTLAALQQPAPWDATLRAYFLGHLGKYVPGKAMAVILRIAAVLKWAPSMRLAIISTMLETLTMMAVGALLAAAISAYLLRSRPELAAIAVATAIVVGLPTLPPIIRRIAGLGLARENQQPDATAPAADLAANLAGINFRLLLHGWSAALICWLLLALSLWATLRAIGVGDVNLFADFARLVAAVAMAVVAGFVSMLPGGLGVRDLALVQLLSERCGPGNALVAAILLRLIWLVSEAAACVILYIAAKIRHRGP